jgi:Fe/S biogenesis protein NfuA
MELTITERAQSVVRSFMEQSEGELRALRIAAHPGGAGGPRFELSLVSDADRADDDVQVDMGDFLVLVSQESAGQLEGATVDYVERVNESGVNPAVAAHGGEIVLVDVKGNEIFIQMAGGCQGCALSRMTLKQGVERMVRQAIPEITAVHDVTDHTSGENPFY